METNLKRFPTGRNSVHAWVEAKIVGKENEEKNAAINSLEFPTFSFGPLLRTGINFSPLFVFRFSLLFIFPPTFRFSLPFLFLFLYFISFFAFLGLRYHENSINAIAAN